MKKNLIILSSLLLLGGCTKLELEEYEPINLGNVSTTTSIQSVNQIGNVVNVRFETTIGAKYSVQITPFGSETPVIKEGFTANELTTERIYDLSNLPKRDYDLTLIDISGKEVKHPIVVK